MRTAGDGPARTRTGPRAGTGKEERVLKTTRAVAVGIVSACLILGGSAPLAAGPPEGAEVSQSPPVLGPDWLGSVWAEVKTLLGIEGRRPAPKAASTEEPESVSLECDDCGGLDPEHGPGVDPNG